MERHIRGTMGEEGKEKERDKEINNRWQGKKIELKWTEKQWVTGEKRGKKEKKTREWGVWERNNKNWKKGVALGPSVQLSALSFTLLSYNGNALQDNMIALTHIIHDSKHNADTRCSRKHEWRSSCWWTQLTLETKFLAKLSFLRSKANQSLHNIASNYKCPVGIELAFWGKILTINHT